MASRTRTASVALTTAGTLTRQVSAWPSRTTIPNILAFKSPSGGNFQIRVPIDDTHPWHLMYNTRLPPDGEEPTVTVYDVPWRHEDGRLYLDTVIGTDMMAWITPGPLA